ncbi:MAG: ribonuclease G, partial [Armatimonadetes bacterium CG_4_9_14_3_um_filter_58_7]
MKTRILVNVDHGETRVAVLEDGRLFDFSLERENRLVGNVYKGRVVNVLPGMDAAFVEIGLSRNAFIYVTDVSPEAQTATSFRDVDAAHRY